MSVPYRLNQRTYPGGLLLLPNEILLAIAELLEYSWDINSLTQTNRRLYSLLNSYLYQRNVDQSQSSALEWAADRGHASTARKVLDEGGDPDACVGFPRHPLVRAAAQGHEEVFRVLLERAINARPKTRGKTTRRLETSLWLAVTNGHVGIARLLIQHGINPDNMTQGKSCLHAAASTGRLDMVKFFVDEVRCDPHSVPRIGYTPLVGAVQSGAVDVIRYLLQIGVDPNLRVQLWGSQAEVTAIYFAAAKGQMAAIQCLIDHGAEPNPSLRPVCAALEEDHFDVARLLLECTNTEDLPTREHEQGILLCAAAACNCEPLVRRLLDSCCSTMARQAQGSKFFTFRGGWTALTWVARLGHEKVASLLLERGALPESKDWPFTSPYPLRVAIGKGHGHMVKLLLEHGADPNFLIGSNSPLLFGAIPHEEIFKLLLEHGADWRIVETSQRSTSLVVKVVMSGKTELVRMLLRRGAEPRTTPDHWLPQSQSLLHPGVVGGAQMLDFLFQHGLQLPAPDSLEAKYAVDTAISWGDIETLKLLMDRGYVNVAPDDDIPSALDRVVQLEDKSIAATILDILISHGIDIESRDEQQQTCLWKTIHRDDDAGLKLLLDRGANPLSRDADNDTPLSCAGECGFTAGIQLLLESIKTREFSNDEVRRELSVAESNAADAHAWAAAKVLQRAQIDLAGLVG